MQAGKPISGYWATPAPGTKAEFDVDSVEEKFVARPLRAAGNWPYPNKANAGIRTEFGLRKCEALN